MEPRARGLPSCAPESYGAARQRLTEPRARVLRSRAPEAYRAARQRLTEPRASARLLCD